MNVGHLTIPFEPLIVSLSAERLMSWTPIADLHPPSTQKLRGVILLHVRIFHPLVPFLLCPCPYGETADPIHQIGILVRHQFRGREKRAEYVPYPTQGDDVGHELRKANDPVGEHQTLLM